MSYFHVCTIGMSWTLPTPLYSEFKVPQPKGVVVQREKSNSPAPNPWEQKEKNYLKKLFKNLGSTGRNKTIDA